MSWFVRLSLLGAFCLAIFVIAFASSDVGRGSAEGSSPGCLGRLFANPAETADVIFIGSSRTQRSFESDKLAQAAGLAPGEVVNMGHPSIAMDLDLGLIDRITRRMDVSLVVFEVQVVTPAIMEKAPQVDLTIAKLPTGAYTQKFAVEMTTAEQFRHIRQNSENLALALWETSSLQLARLQTVANILFRTTFAADYRHELFNPDAGMDPEQAGRRVACFVDALSNEDPDFQGALKRDRQARERFAHEFLAPPLGMGWTDPDPAGFFTSPDLESRRDLVRQMVDLSQRRGFKVAFLYLPAIHVPIDTATVQDRFQAEFGAPLLVPDDDMREAFAQDGYKDSSHLNMTGRALLTPWLGTEVRQLLGDGAS